MATLAPVARCAGPSGGQSVNEVTALTAEMAAVASLLLR